MTAERIVGAAAGAATGILVPLRGATKRSFWVTFLLFEAALHPVAAEAPSEKTEPPAAAASARLAPDKNPAHKISYVGGQLQIDAVDATLPEVLARVAALTGVKIDVPPDTSTERMALVQLGPGPPRQVLAALLSDSNLDYLIQASDSDPEKIQSVLLMPRQKKESGPGGTELAARPLRSPYSRAAAQKQEAEVPDTSVAAQPEITTVDASSSDAPAPVPPMQLPLSQQQPGMTRSAALSPPPVMNSQSINQQLQQMYQQRMQMIQQDRQTGVPAGSANPVNARP